ncbi:MAG: hypothetical protein E6J34_13000 [Chloroflexi bacterium]|nr:MAG: hypothetical protein E6J34_13000 [Chloroflexota bacterium]
MIKNPHLYDSSLKALLEGHTAEILTHLLPEVKVGKELNSEVLKPPLRADRLYLARYGRQVCILHIELETRVSGTIVYRLIEYYGILYRKYRKPIVPVIIYPFRSKKSLPKTPLDVKVGSETILNFSFRILALWHLQAQQFLDKHAISMYALLPTMQGATYNVLRRALDEMKDGYGDNKRLLAERILLFDVFLLRSDMVSLEDKEKIGKELEMFESLIEESRLLRKKTAEARAQALTEGKIEGKIEGEQQAILKIVQTRFPLLADEAQQKIKGIKELTLLESMIEQFLIAPDENVARSLLRPSIA